MPTELDLTLRPADVSDAAAVADVHLSARRTAAMPPPVHPDHEVREWLDGRLRSTDTVWVAEVDGVVGGYARFTESWLDDLYVAPALAGRGVGSALLDLVKQQRPGGFCLWVFEMNTPAHVFYSTPRPGRAGTHRRVRERGAGARHQDGLARSRPALLLPPPDRRRG